MIPLRRFLSSLILVLHSRRFSASVSSEISKRSEVIKAVIVYTCKELKRDNGMIIRYDDNAAVKKSKLVLSPERGLERASTQDSAYFNSRIRSLGSTLGGLPREGSPRSPMADSSEASPSSLVIHSPSPEVSNSMKHTLGCLVMVLSLLYMSIYYHIRKSLLGRPFKAHYCYFLTFMYHAMWKSACHPSRYYILWAFSRLRKDIYIYIL
ncbi:hypothetical protein ACOSQ2_031640 [Xanthoceras sorbifolium]